MRSVAYSDILNEVSDVLADTYVTLYALQHRGQESCGMVTNDDGILSYHRDLGYVRCIH